MQCLGLDIGSSSIKGAVLDLAEGRVTSVVRETFPAAIEGLPSRHFEVDPQQVMAGVLRVLQQLSEQAPHAQAVYFCGQMGGVILVDPTGRPVTNYLSWRDQRTLEHHPAGGSYLDQIQQRWTQGEFAELGNELKPGSATSLLFWLKENGKLSQTAIPATIGDFVIGQLCGTAPRMDPTHAIGLLNLVNGDWHYAAFAQLGIDSLQWLPFANVHQPVGKWRIGDRAIPCYPCLGDQQCALHGAGLQEHELSLNISTGSQVSRLSSSVTLGNYQTRRYFDGLYLNTITHLPAGRSLNVLFDLFTELPRSEGVALTNAWSYIAKAVSESTDESLICDLDFFSGPMGEQGQISHITVDNFSIGNVFHAAFRYMADTFQVCAKRLDPEQSWSRIALSGGLTQSVPILRKLIEQRFSSPLRESVEQEETLMGLLKLAKTQATGE